MVVPVGSLINAGVVVIGAFAGTLLGARMPERVRVIVFQGLGLCTLAIGMQMALKTANPLYMVGSILLGALAGEALRLEERLAGLGDRLKRSLGSGGLFTEGFVAATLLFCVGSMAVLGPLQEGLDGDRTMVLTKSLLDLFAAMALGAAYGPGVAFSALPLLAYQGGITLGAAAVSPYLTAALRSELEATGGILIMGIGINLLNLLRIRLANLLPALVVVICICIIVG